MYLVRGPLLRNILAWRDRHCFPLRIVLIFLVAMARTHICHGALTAPTTSAVKCGAWPPLFIHGDLLGQNVCHLKKKLLYYKSALDQSLIHFWSSVVNYSAFNAGLLMTELQNNLHFTIWIKLISFKELCVIVVSTMGDILGQVMCTCIWKLYYPCFRWWFAFYLTSSLYQNQCGCIINRPRERYSTKLLPLCIIYIKKIHS